MLNSTIQGFLAVAEWLRGQLAEAERAFVSSLAGWQETDQLTVTVWAAYSLAQVQRSLGRLNAASRTSQRALDVTEVPGGELAGGRAGAYRPGRGRLPAR